MITTYLNDYDISTFDCTNNKLKLLHNIKSTNKISNKNKVNKEELYLKHIEILNNTINHEREQKIISDMEFTQQIATIINGMVLIIVAIIYYNIF